MPEDAKKDDKVVQDLPEKKSLADIVNPQELKLPKSFLDAIREIGKGNRFQNDVLSKLEKAISTYGTSKRSEKTVPKDNYGKLLTAFNNNSKKQTTALNQVQKSLDRIADLQSNKDDDTGEEAKDALTEVKAQPVKITDISDPAVEKITKSLKALGVTIKQGSTENTTSDSGGVFSILSKVFGKGLLPLFGGLAGSLVAAIGSWFNDGPFKGTLKLVGEQGAKFFSEKIGKLLPTIFPKLFGIVKKFFSSISSSVLQTASKLMPEGGILAKIVGPFVKFLGPILKRLPVIGTIINIGSAISRFIQGDILGGLIDIGSAVAVMIPGLGTAISVGLGLINAYRDLSGKTEESKKSYTEGGGIKGVMSRVGEWVTTNIKKSIRYLPGIGTLIQLGDAFDNFASGNIPGGFKSLLKSGLTLFPGFGSIVAWMLEDKQEETQSVKDTPQKFNFSTILKSIGEAVKKKLKSLMEMLRKVAPDFIVDKIESYLDIKPDTDETYTKNAGQLKRQSEIINNSDVGIPSVQQVSVVPSFVQPAFKTQPIESIPQKPVIEKNEKELEQPKQSTIEPPVLDKKDIIPEVQDDTKTILKQSKASVKELHETIQKEQAIKKPIEKTVATPTIPLKPITTPQLPLSPPVAATAVSHAGILAKLDELIKAVNKTVAISNNNSSSAALNSVAGGNAITNIFNNGSDRDVPYLERTKYREQLQYARGLL